MHSLVEKSKIERAILQLTPSRRQALLRALAIDSGGKITLKSLHKIFASEKFTTKIKESALTILLSVGDKRSSSIFLQLFCATEIDPILFPFSVWFLSSVPSRLSLNSIESIILTSSNIERRPDAAYILRAYSKDERAMNLLVDILNDKLQTVDTRSNAAESLGVIGDNRHSKVLAKHLDDESIDVAFWCIYALWQICMNASVIPQLEKFIGNKTIIDKCFVVEQEAMAAIRTIRARANEMKKFKNKSKVSHWDIHEEVRLAVEKYEAETGEFYKDMSYFRKNKLKP